MFLNDTYIRNFRFDSNVHGHTYKNYTLQNHREHITFLRNKEKKIFDTRIPISHSSPSSDEQSHIQIIITVFLENIRLIQLFLKP